MDNFRVDITGDDQLEAALALAFSRWKGATHWSNEGEHGLFFYWHDPNRPGAVALPTSMNANLVTPIVKAWLDGYEPKKPGWAFDGSVGHGFRVYNHGERFGGWSYAICAVQPVTALYGK